MEKLHEQVVDLEELIVTHRKESESLQAEQQRVQAENDSAKDEVCPHSHTSPQNLCSGSGVVIIDPLRFLAGCHKVTKPGSVCHLS